MTEDETDLIDVAPGAPHNNIMSEVVAYCLLYTNPSPPDRSLSRMPSSA
jgi:hypothetical protein